MSSDQDVSELVRHVAEHLDGFTFEESEHRGAYLVAADGRKIFLAKIWNKQDRLDVHGVYYGDYYFRDGDRPEITVGMTRGAEAIAKEITRRFLPRYDELFAKVDEAIRQARASEAASQSTAERLAAVLPVAKTPVARPGQSKNRIDWYSNGAAGYGHVDVSYSGDSVSEIEIRTISVDVCERILRVLAEAEIEANVEKAPVLAAAALIASARQQVESARAALALAEARLAEAERNGDE